MKADGTPQMTAGQWKRLDTFIRNLEGMVDIYGIDHVAEVTWTFSDDLPGHDRKEMQRRWHSLANALTRIFGHRVRVTERGKKTDRLHIHCLVQTFEDVRARVDFEAFTAAEERSRAVRSQGGDVSRDAQYRAFMKAAIPSNHVLRAKYWPLLKHLAKGHGFGLRCRMMPIRTKAEAAARYFAKYVAKDYLRPKREEKHARAVSFTRRFPRAVPLYCSPLTPAAANWRSQLAMAARYFGIEEGDGDRFREWKDYKKKPGGRWISKPCYAGWKDKFGKRWCFENMKLISNLIVPANAGQLLMPGLFQITETRWLVDERGPWAEDGANPLDGEDPQKAYWDPEHWNRNIFAAMERKNERRKWKQRQRKAA